MDRVQEVESGDGWAVGTLAGMGDGWGFRKVRKALGVTAFGVNAIVMPPGFDAGVHFHDEQQELYVVLEGEIEFTLADEKRLLGPGAMARVEAATVRGVRNVGDGDATYLCVGGKDGYVGRDGRVVEGADYKGPVEPDTA